MMNYDSTFKRVSIALLFFVISGLNSTSFGMCLEMEHKIKGEKFDASTIKKIESTIGYQFKNKKLLMKALTTRAKNPDENYERYEYFGDKVLDVVIAKILLQEYPDAPEGALTGARQALVSQEPLAALCLRLGLHEYIQDAKSSVPLSSLCDIVESTVGAICEDGGSMAAQDFVLRFFLPMIKDKKCPQMTSVLVKAAASTLKEDVRYEYKDDTCILTKSAGKGCVTTNLDKGYKLKGSYDTKKDPKRLARYCAEREFIQKELDEKYQECVVRLATDADYKPMDNVPALTMSWNVGEKDNYRVCLHTVMQMLGRQNPSYSFKDGDQSAGTRFVCTLDNHLFESPTCSASTKSEAEEAVAQIAYKEIQKAVILTKDLVHDSQAIAALDKKDPVTSLNLMCQALKLQAPTYTNHYREKNGAVALYSRMGAPWLMTEIEGPLEATVNEAKVRVAARVTSLMQHFSDGYIEPKKLQLLCDLGGTTEPLGTLIRLSQATGLQNPRIETTICEGPVSEGLCFETAITVADKKWGNRVITGCKAPSKAEAERAAAKKALNYVANKMFEDEITKD
ncbi:MAG: putative dsRNA-binding protein [Candidatus Dependentiae bacterium]|nr:putative dsRNA-binding protein [Candidatus Dependentiae bacterium]